MFMTLKITLYENTEKFSYENLFNDTDSSRILYYVTRIWAIENDLLSVLEIDGHLI